MLLLLLLIREYFELIMVEYIFDVEVFDCVVLEEAVVVIEDLVAVEVAGFLLFEEFILKSLFFTVDMLVEEDVVMLILLFGVLLNVDAMVVVVWVTTAVNFVNNYVCLVLFVLKLTCNTRLPNV